MRRRFWESVSGWWRPSPTYRQWARYTSDECEQVDMTWRHSVMISPPHSCACVTLNIINRSLLRCRTISRIFRIQTALQPPQWTATFINFITKWLVSIFGLKCCIWYHRPYSYNPVLLHYNSYIIYNTGIIYNATTEAAPDGDKDNFYNQLQTVMDTVPSHHLKILTGDAPWLFNRLRRYISFVLTYLLTYLLT